VGADAEDAGGSLVAEVDLAVVELENAHGHGGEAVREGVEARRVPVDEEVRGEGAVCHALHVAVPALDPQDHAVLLAVRVDVEDPACQVAFPSLEGVMEGTSS
jgi:hypothetical protein